MKHWKRVLAIASCSIACGNEDDDDPGALISVEMAGRVGVTLDEIPESMRDRVAAAFIAEPLSFWETRARLQTRMTSYRLAFRQFFYEEPKFQLPLPPAEGLHYAFETPVRTEVDGHDAVVIDYVLTATLLSDAVSPGESEPALAKPGGTWEETFVLPLDPEFLRQRTGFACVDESDFPPNSSDEENIADFFDDTCEVENPEEASCHLTPPFPEESCVEALENHIGAVPTTIHFERIAWDPALADEARIGEVTTPDAPDLEVIPEAIEDSARLVYRYVPADSCTMIEGCVEQPGWRRLLQFDASVKNVGGTALHLGDVDYYQSGSGSELASHNIFEFSACHNHYHFRFYGDFAFNIDDPAEGFKQAFCLQTTSRSGNHEQSPLLTPYGTCEYQGISAGWGDDYIAGLDCQWVDVTNIPITGDSITAPLAFVSNPDRFLCEGAPVLDADGAQRYEPSEFRTELGDTVDRPMCDFSDGWDGNNVGERDVVVPAVGSYVTAPCNRGQEGPLRNCGFQLQDDAVGCTPGETVTLGCSVADGGPPQVLRVCPTSAVLGVPMACSHAASFGNATIEGAMGTVAFACPMPLDATEPGGEVSLFAAPIFNADGPAEVTCMPL